MIASIYCRSDGHSSTSRETCVTLVSDAFESDDNTHTTRSSRSSNGSTDVITIDSIDDSNNNNNNNNNKQIFKGAVIKGMLNGTSRYVKRPSFQNESKSGILFKDYDS